MSQTFEGKVVVVSGGASGIGLACARAFLEKGARVAIVDLSDSALETARADLADSGEVMAIAADITRSDQVDKAFAAVVDRWEQVDVAINSAGIGGSEALVGEGSEEDFDRVIAVNLKGLWLCMRAALQQMEKQGAGNIINMGSALGSRVHPGASAYISSKFAVAGLTRTAAVEYGERNIRINAICPGYIATPLLMARTADDQERLQGYQNLHAMKRLGTPEEVAKAALWLASDDASFTTGALIAVDGGWTAH